MSKSLKVAAIQAEPVWNDLQGGVNKSIGLIQEAAKNGANVIGFPEVFIPGYPWYVTDLKKHGQISLFIFRSIWANSPTENAPWINEYFKNSLERESPEMDQIRAAVREAGVFVVLGYSERYKGTLYIAQVSCATERTTRRTDGVSLSSTRPAPLFFTAARSSPPTLSVLSTVTDRVNL